MCFYCADIVHYQSELSMLTQTAETAELSMLTQTKDSSDAIATAVTACSVCNSVALSPVGVASAVATPLDYARMIATMLLLWLWLS